MEPTGTSQCSQKSATRPYNLLRQAILFIYVASLVNFFWILILRCATALTKQQTIIPSVLSLGLHL
jgi:C4-dicarboxylate transporter